MGKITIWFRSLKSAKDHERTEAISHALVREREHGLTPCENGKQSGAREMPAASRDNRRQRLNEGKGRSVLVDRWKTMLATKRNCGPPFWRELFVWWLGRNAAQRGRGN